MSTQFKSGDVVTLSSGGPSMTIQRIEGDVCTCAWFDNENKAQFQIFQIEGLIKEE